MKFLSVLDNSFYCDETWFIFTLQFLAAWRIKNLLRYFSLLELYFTLNLNTQKLKTLHLICLWQKIWRNHESPNHFVRTSFRSPIGQRIEEIPISKEIKSKLRKSSHFYLRPVCKTVEYTSSQTYDSVVAAVNSGCRKKHRFHDQVQSKIFLLFLLPARHWLIVM